MYKVVWFVGEVKNGENYGTWCSAAERAEELSELYNTVFVKTYVNGVLIETEEF